MQPYREERVLRIPPAGLWRGRGEPSPEIPQKSETRQNERERQSSGQEKLVCRQCLQFITTIAERIEIQGDHRHTFSNPAGLLFQIGCFRRAKGCEPASRQEAEWSWFRGYTWQVVLCSSCATHMGWRYESRRDFFYGLILHRLMQES